MRCTCKVFYKIRDKRQVMSVEGADDLQGCWTHATERRCHGMQKRKAVARCAGFLAPGVSRRVEDKQGTKKYMILLPRSGKDFWRIEIVALE
jgi:hypothetical protein